MPPYRIEFKNHGGHVYGTEHIVCANDAEAIASAHRHHVPGIGYGFDLWEGDRLVHAHPQPRAPKTSP